MKTLLDVVKDCDNFPYPEDTDQNTLWKFYLPNDPRPHGLLTDAVVAQMPWTTDFQILPEAKQIRLLQPPTENWEERCSALIEQQVEAARSANAFPDLGLRRGEEFPIVGARFAVGIDRAAFSLFGTIGRGVHLTAYTGSGAEMRIWVPRRNYNKAKYPGMLDNSVAGGMASGERPLECLVREAQEEAGLSEEMIRAGARAAGTVTWITVSDERAGGHLGLINPGVLYVYDLEVSPEMVFTPVDGELCEFRLRRVEEVKKALLAGEFKPASANVMIDFFVRHGLITAEDEEDYEDIVARLHRKLPLPTSARS
ncbi:NUDIX hydrolase domain-like protein [Aspergillus avenaceus]|uniref:NUDIX hydrolase domain-like protein n=1 Tax=Aspergillus avenaceus TaxID=36643 RepID=A0A5N6TNB8_ASPAV|nr:NUDIX hydrolase domain-like protein [Aspergillus avenaceus]